MATNSEEFQKHARENASIYATAIKNNRITKDDFQAAANVGGKYSFADQDAALKRIHDAFGEFASEHPDDKRVQNFVSGIPAVKKFTPSKDDWMSYDNEHMARLAEQMKFNWKNVDDRSEMMKMLMNEQVAKDKQQVYKDYKKEHPAASFINENILLPNMSKRLERGQDVTNTDVALDMANIGTYLTPGAGIAASGLKKGILFGTDAALQAAVGAASDVNQGNKLGLHNITQPLIGAGAGAVTDLVPRLGKTIVDVSTGGFGGQIGQPVSDAAENLITKVFGDEVSAAKRALAKDAKEAAKETTVRKNVSQASKAKLKAQGKDITPNAQVKHDAKQKNYYANHPEKWSQHAPNMTDEEYMRFIADPRFKTVIQSNTERLPKILQVGKDVARGLSRAAGKDIMITYSNRDRNKNSVPSIEEVYASPELADYIRLKKLGYDPQIPSKFKDYEDEINSKSRIESLYGF